MTVKPVPANWDQMTDADKAAWVNDPANQGSTATQTSYKAIPEQLLKGKAAITGDPVTDARNWVLILDAGLRSTGFTDEQRAAISAAYAAATDDYARLVKERDTASAAKPTPLPAVTTTAPQLPRILPDGTVEWYTNPNYTAPAAPAPRNIDPYSPEVRNAEHANRMAELDRASELRTNERYAEIKAKLASGEIMEERARLELEAFNAQELARRQSDYRQLDIDKTFANNQQLANDEYQRGLPVSAQNQARAQLAEERAQLSQRMSANQAKAALLDKQASEGMASIDRGVAAGVAPVAGALRTMYFDPHQRALDVIGQEMNKPDFDPQQRMLDLIGQYMTAGKAAGPQPPTVAPTIGPPRAPLLPPGQAGLPGQDPNILQ